MFIEYNKINGIEYGRLRMSVRKGANVSHKGCITLGRVIDVNFFKNGNSILVQLISNFLQTA